MFCCFWLSIIIHGIWAPVIALHNNKSGVNCGFHINFAGTLEIFFVKQHNFLFFAIILNNPSELQAEKVAMDWHSVYKFPQKKPQSHLNHFNFISCFSWEWVMLCSCSGLKIVLSLSMVGYQETATANGLYIAMVTFINKEVGPFNVCW